MTDLDSISAVDLINTALSRKDPEAAKSLYMLTSYKEPMFVAAWREQAAVVQTAVDDLHDVIEWLRETKNFAQADRVRTIAGRLARSVGKYPAFSGYDDSLIRNIARDWPNQLSPKESRKIFAENERLKSIIAKLQEAK